MSPDKMITMANQIATFFDSQPGDRAGGVADHINDFWEPRMRSQLLEYIAAGGARLHPLVMDAAERIAAPTADA